MKNRIPSSFKDAISFDWWKYLISVVVISVLWYYIYQTKDALKDYEILSIYSNCLTSKDGLFQNVIDGHKDDGIESMEFNNVGDDAYTMTLLQSKGLLDGDILILYEKYVDATIKTNAFTFSQIYQEKIKTINPCSEFLSFDTKVVGVKIFDLENEEYNRNFLINTYFDFKQTTYLLLNSKSNNADIDGKYSYSQCAIESFLYLIREKYHGF